MQDKQNFTIISLAVLLFGIILYIKGKKKPEEDVEDEEEPVEVDDDTYFCKKCGHQQELDYQELQNKKYYCVNCKVENVI